MNRLHPQAFWQTLNPGLPLPPLPEDPLPALEALFAASADGDYFCTGFHEDPDPWPRLALGVAQDVWQERLAMQLAGLVNVGGNDSGDAWFLDIEPDAGGEHRIYWHYHDSLETEPLCRGIAAFLNYLALLRSGEQGDVSDEEFEARSLAIPGVYKGEGDPDWDRSEDDGWEAFSRMHDHRLQDTFIQYAARDWPQAGWNSSPPTTCSKRTWMVELLDAFVGQKRLLLPPDLDVEALPPPRRRLVRELRSFAEAIEADAIPDLVQQYVGDRDPVLGRAAQAWLRTFESSRPPE